jgi:oligo-1,6-glucosidase
MTEPRPRPATDGRTGPGVDAEPWWKSAVVYQIYPRSFADSDGDGVGDIRGIIDHLDHLEELGVDVIWLSPVFRSPHDDNGYDISDYQDIDPVFGTLSDVDELIADVHGRGMRIIMDLVVNHTSDEHPWFVASRQSRSAPTSDWYIWRDARPGTVGGQPGAEPNNWGSFFSGSAWEWVPAREQYYLHLFSKKQPDLNWENPGLREAVFAMMSWWLDRGVDGFRMDVINFISKDPSLPDGKLMSTGYGDGTPSFSYGPRVHEYLSEMQATVFGPRPGVYLTVGEMPAVTPEQALAFTDETDGQLSMVFQFEHVDLDSDGEKWTPRPVTVLDIKESLGRWQSAMGSRGWNSLYWNNHDQSRAVSRFGDDRTYWYESATALATVLHLHRGTPYVYQGEEIGMTNVPFNTIDDFRDIESLNYYDAEVHGRGRAPDDVLASLRRKSRDNARTPMQWNADDHAGFTDGIPWMPVNPNARHINAEAQRHDARSVLAHYRRLIALRHQEPVVVDGDFEMILARHPQLYAFRRTSPESQLTVYANLSSQPVTVQLAEHDADATLLLGNYHAGTDGPDLRPWEARVLIRRADG